MPRLTDLREEGFAFCVMDYKKEKKRENKAARVGRIQLKEGG